jgi:predicted nuclease with TOPRIM domain
VILKNQILSGNYLKNMTDPDRFDSIVNTSHELLTSLRPDFSNFRALIRSYVITAELRAVIQALELVQANTETYTAQLKSETSMLNELLRSFEETTVVPLSKTDIRASFSELTSRYMRLKRDHEVLSEKQLDPNYSALTQQHASLKSELASLKSMSSNDDESSKGSYNQLLQDFTILQAKSAQQATENTNLQASNITAQRNATRLQTELTALQGRYTVLENEYRGLQATINRLQNRVEPQTASVKVSPDLKQTEVSFRKSSGYDWNTQRWSQKSYSHHVDRMSDTDSCKDDSDELCRLRGQVAYLTWQVNSMKQVLCVLTA